MSSFSSWPPPAACRCPMADTLDTENPASLAGTCGGSQFILFMGVLETFLRLQCDISDPCHRPPIDLRLPDSVAEATFDYIVIGAGSAGAIVASRLSENPAVRVLLIEAGGEETAGSRVPAFFTAYVTSSANWRYRLRPNGRSYLGKLPTYYWFRGRALGGTSTINGMQYFRGTREEFDRWAKRLGCRGWSWPEVEPFYRRVERRMGIRPGWAGMEESGVPRLRQMVREFEATARECGFGVHDMNGDGGGNQTGAMVVPLCVRGGVRQSTASEYLRPAWARRNLHVRVFTLATRVLVRDDASKRAYGVETVDRDGNIGRWFARREIILSAGTIESPKLLMLSGIGPPAHLRQLGIPTRVRLPGVGGNLQNHMGVRLEFESPTHRLEQISSQMADEYLRTRRGLLSTQGATLIFRYRSPLARPGAGPDVQLVLTDSFTSPTNVCSETGQANQTSLLLQTYGFALHPSSRGRIRLNSSDPLQPPDCWPNELAVARDVEVILDAVHQMLRLAGGRELRKYGFRLRRQGGEACAGFRMRSDEYWRCVIRQETTDVFHIAGTCKMAPEDDRWGVVDERLRVRGVSGLRVADASVMPEVVAANTAATCMMIGERAAQMVADDNAIQ